ncbi:MAG: hypothetical protein GKR94_05995 [Gammaproteobacteria bacterium]|nr:hypothetical protein [Gammaproteobacteria bacterium]
MALKPLENSQGALARARVLTLLLALHVAPAQLAAQETIHPTYLNDANLTEVERTVKSGADVNAKHIGGATALHHLVAVSAQMGLTGLVIRNKQIIRPGQWAATGHETIAVYLVEEGAQVDALNTAGQTPLHIAALTGHSAAVEFLLEHGADVTARDNDGKTALDWAHWSASDEAIEELGKALGARIDAKGVRRRAEKVMGILEANGAQ